MIRHLQTQCFNVRDRSASAPPLSSMSTLEDKLPVAKEKAIEKPEIESFQMQIENLKMELRTEKKKNQEQLIHFRDREQQLELQLRDRELEIELLKKEKEELEKKLETSRVVEKQVVEENAELRSKREKKKHSSIKHSDTRKLEKKLRIETEKKRELEIEIFQLTMENETLKEKLEKEQDRNPQPIQQHIDQLNNLDTNTSSPTFEGMEINEGSHSELLENLNRFGNGLTITKSAIPLDAESLDWWKQLKDDLDSLQEVEKESSPPDGKCEHLQSSGVEQPVRNQPEIEIVSPESPVLPSPPPSPVVTRMLESSKHETSKPQGVKKSRSNLLMSTIEKFESMKEAKVSPKPSTHLREFPKTGQVRVKTAKELIHAFEQRANQQSS